MEYITVENNVITGNFCSNTLPENAIQVENFNGIVGEPLTYYNDDYKRKDDISLYIEGVKSLPTGYKLNEDKTDIVEMSEVEKIQSGIQKLPDGMKIENGELVQMSSKELFDSGLITEDQYNTIVKSQVDSEINIRLSAINTTENQAKAFIDDDFKEEMKTALKKVLSVKEQPGYPLVVSWTDIPESL